MNSTRPRSLRTHPPTDAFAAGLNTSPDTGGSEGPLEFPEPAVPVAIGIALTVAARELANQPHVVERLMTARAHVFRGLPRAPDASVSSSVTSWPRYRETQDGSATQ